MSISKKNCSWATEAIMQDSTFTTQKHLPCLNKSTSPRALAYLQHLNLVTVDLIDNCQSSAVRITVLNHYLFPTVLCP